MDNNAAHLAVEIQHAQPPLQLVASFSLTKPWTILFGPSGSGKTTILRAIAGFVRPDRGCIVLRPHTPQSQVLADSGSKYFLPPHRRAVRSAAQSAWLFPGTVWSNIVYGTRWKSPKDEAEELMRIFRLEALAGSNVSRLSGGERQRVSLARAAASAVYPAGPDPVNLLLLDEPFTGLDSRLRDEIIAGLQPWLERHAMPVLSVTHDPVEALLLRAEVIRIAEGRCVAQGPAAEVLAEEHARLRGVLG